MNKCWITRNLAIAALVAAAWGSLGRPAAADDSKVKGKVHDEKGTPLPDAAIVLEDTSSGHKYSIKAGKDGSFYQRGIFPATYTMKVEKEGYTPHILEEVKVQAGVERSFDLTLESIAARSAEIRKEKFGEAYVAGIDAFQKGDFETALARAEETIVKRPDDPKGYEMKSKALIGLKRYDEAIPVLEKQIGMPDPPKDVNELLAGCHFNAGAQANNEDKTDAAIAHWEKALAGGYPDPALEHYLGQAYLQKQDFEKAKAHLQAYLAKKPNAADAEQVKQLLAGLQGLGAKK